MLTFHVLNVGHGSSVIVEHEAGGERSFGLIDSNAGANQTPRALTKLQQLGATRLSFLCLTHPHKDHFSGLYSIIVMFKDLIDHFYSCPMGDFLTNRSRLKKFASKLRILQDRTDSADHRRAVHEFLQILQWADTAARHGRLHWYECSGDALIIAPPGFAGVEMLTLVPPNRAKGTYIEQIEHEDPCLIGTVKENEISLALQFSFAGIRVILGGDSTKANWEARRRYERNKASPIAAQVVNLPHHGSRYDCDDAVLSQLFALDGERFGISSGNGLSHPDLDVIKWLEKNQIRPYCTNLIPACGANTQKLLILAAYDPRLARWLREVADNTGQVQPCQGDVSIRISASGDLEVVPEHANACAFRGDYHSLFSRLR